MPEIPWDRGEKVTAAFIEATVVAVGEAVEAFSPGDRVWHSSLGPVPAGLSQRTPLCSAN